MWRAVVEVGSAFVVGSAPAGAGVADFGAVAAVAGGSVAGAAEDVDFAAAGVCAEGAFFGVGVNAGVVSAALPAVVDVGVVWLGVVVWAEVFAELWVSELVPPQPATAKATTNRPLSGHLC